MVVSFVDKYIGFLGLQSGTEFRILGVHDAVVYKHLLLDRIPDDVILCTIFFSDAGCGTFAEFAILVIVQCYCIKRLQPEYRKSSQFEYIFLTKQAAMKGVLTTPLDNGHGLSNSRVL